MGNDQNKKYYLNTRFQRSAKEIHAAPYYIQGIESGDALVLSEAITLIESKEPAKAQLGREIYEHFFDLEKKSTRISTRLAITGAPGVGKSTFIENFGTYLAEKNHTLAILAIDPSSQITGGSILGDKTRMEQLSTLPNVYIRPSSAGGVLGGVASGTRSALLLCEAAGFDTIIIETVGVGQSEYLASMMVDLTLLLIQPGAGDDVQGIKRGILELADILIVNRAEQNNIMAAKQTAADYKNAVNLFHQSGETPVEVLTCSSIERKGFDAIHSTLYKLMLNLRENGRLQNKRTKQEVYWFEKLLQEKLLEYLTSGTILGSQMEDLKNKVKAGSLSSVSAVNHITSLLKKLNWNAD